MFRKTFILALGLAGALTTHAAFAGSATGTLNVTGTVTNSCTTSGGSLSFGTLDGVTAATGSGSISVTCTNGTSATIALDKGLGSGASIAARQMAGVTDNTKSITYSLFSDSGHSTLWGDGTNGSTLSYSGTGNADTVPVYGSIAASQHVPAQVYNDSVTVTVAY
ncbi:MAG: spore coat protein U domain-containing protein [Acetobacteraceae bacterium]|nr:spore coat protein U domain-containing protein [Acetobacteraceae bacterium]